MSNYLPALKYRYIKSKLYEHRTMAGIWFELEKTVIFFSGFINDRNSKKNHNTLSGVLWA